MLPRHRYNEAMAPRCVVRTNNSSFWTKISQKFSTFTSAIASNSQPTQPTQSTQISNNMPPNPSQQPGGTQARRTRRGATSFSQISSKWILFGVQGSRLSVELEHIEIDEYVNDSSFFRALRQHYRKHRGILKLMFSVWRLGYCDNFKVSFMANIKLNS